ncbi:MAG: right-handed parallel beta-helix repeat-containing protein [Elusimicrobiota bacterium]
MSYGTEGAHEASQPGLFEDVWAQVLALLAIVSGMFTAHYFLTRPVPKAAALPIAEKAAQVKTSVKSAFSTLTPRMPGHWVIDAQDSPDADCATLQAALSAARDGDTLTIKPGIYREGLFINRAVTLQGAGQTPDKVEIISAGAQTIGLSTGRATLRNLSITNTGSREQWVVVAAKARLVLDKVRMRSAGQGVRCVDSDLDITDSDLDARVTLSVEGKSKVKVERTRISGEQTAVAASGGGADVTLSRSSIQDSRGTGVDASRFARVRITDSTLSGNSSAAVLALSGAEVRVTGGDIRDNRDCAVRLDGSLVVLEKVLVSKNRCGAGFLGPATLEANGSTFSDLTLGPLAIKPGLEDVVTVRGSGNHGLTIPAKR